MKKKKKLATQKKKLQALSAIRESTIGQESKYGEMNDNDFVDEDDDTDWIDEEEDNMTDAEEVMRRSWQWKILSVSERFENERE